MMRIARLMRSMPEFFILIKAISAASRSTFFTLAFLFIILYVYGIAFTQLLLGTDIGQEFFSTVPHSMVTLFLYGTLLDEVTSVVDAMGKESVHCTVLFFTFILIAAITLMNILIGVLCEAISAVADRERMNMQVHIVEQTLSQILADGLDDDDDGLISRHEFLKVLESRTAVHQLDEIGIDVVGLVEAADAIFEKQNEDMTQSFDRLLTFEEFMEVLLQLRGENKAKVKDVVDMKKHLNRLIRSTDKLRVENKQILLEVEEFRELSLQGLGAAASAPPALGRSYDCEEV